jgi:hypothetical protein
MSGVREKSALAHGACVLEGVRVESYSVEAKDEAGLVGDRASQTAFRELLGEFQQKLQRGRGAFGGRDLDELGNDELDRIAQQGTGSDAARSIALAIADFSEQFAYVIGRFRKLAAWRDVERIGIGGGFKESAIGRLAIRQTSHRLAREGAGIALRTLHHAADDAGLLGWVQMIPKPLADGRAILAVDIGGTNVRCGIVESNGKGHGGEGDLKKARVSIRDKWKHADSDPEQEDLVEGIVQMLRRVIGQAEAKGIALAPFIGIACPGIIRADGSIERGAQNLPGDWEGASFHLPRRLCENIAEVQGGKTVVLMHNDAVVQGLSELPYMADVKRWAVLTIGTGLGNASFENLQ